jgi:hypothetical protein
LQHVFHHYYNPLKVLFALLILSCFTVFSYSQSYLSNGDFEQHDCTNRVAPVTNWKTSATAISPYVYYSECDTGRDRCSRPTVLKAASGCSYLSLLYRLDAEQNELTFIQSPLKQSLERGMRYEISFDIALSRASISYLDDIQVYFSSVENLGQRHIKMHNWEQYMVSMKDSTDALQSKSWVRLSTTYVADGSERFFSIGNFVEKWKIGLATSRSVKGLIQSNPGISRIPNTNTFLYNAEYCFDNVKIEPLATNWPNWSAEIKEANCHDYGIGNNNLVVNGGFEYYNEPITQRYNQNRLAARILPFWYGHTASAPSAFCIKDASNFFKYGDFMGDQPYNGQGMAGIYALSTNKDHQYQQVQKISKATKNRNYNIIYNYEHTPIRDYEIYEGAQYLTGNLDQPLKAGQDYNFGMMAKLSSMSSFGIRYLGITFLDSLTYLNQSTPLTNEPDVLIDVEVLRRSKGWEQFKNVYRAKGGEQYFAIGYYGVPGDRSPLKNHNFKPVVFQECGPKTYCSDHIYTFKDSLFAYYSIDNVVLQELNLGDVKPAIYPQNMLNQIQFLFDVSMDRSNNVAFEKAKSLVKSSLETLRKHDWICFTSVGKTADRDGPEQLVKFRKIYRQLHQIELRKKKSKSILSPSHIIFSDQLQKGFNNQLVIIANSSENLQTLHEKVTTLTKQGGKLTVLYTGRDAAKKATLKNFTTSAGGVLVDVSDPEALQHFIKAIAASD